MVADGLSLCGLCDARQRLCVLQTRALQFVIPSEHLHGVVCNVIGVRIENLFVYTRVLHILWCFSPFLSLFVSSKAALLKRMRLLTSTVACFFFERRGGIP